MNVAIQLSGMPRDLDNSYKWLKESILDILDDNNIQWDLFGSIWGDHADLSKFLNVFNPTEAGSDVWDKNTANQLGWKELRKFDPVDRPSILGMYYKIQKCNNLRLGYEKENNIKYDVIFRVRTELNFLNKLDIKELQSIVDNNDKRIFLTSIPNDKTFWIRDTFAFGNNESINIYSNLFDNILELNYSTKSSTPEVLLRAWLTSNGIVCYNTNLKYKIRELS